MPEIYEIDQNCMFLILHVTKWKLILNSLCVFRNSVTLMVFVWMACGVVGMGNNSKMGPSTVINHLYVTNCEFIINNTRFVYFCLFSGNYTSIRTHQSLDNHYLDIFLSARKFFICSEYFWCY